MARTHILGFPRIGARRELKFALEAFWRRESNDDVFEQVCRALQERRFQTQREARLTYVTAGDFSFYDHVLDHCALFGALPARFGFDPRRLTLSQYFELARGNARQPAMEMTKWFDTNYHYLVPELSADSTFEGGVDWFFEDVRHALASGGPVKPVLIGPVTYLWLSKSPPGFDRLNLLPQLVEAYARILRRLQALGVEWVQLDEPVLCTDIESNWLNAYELVYPALAQTGIKLLLATYFGDAGEHASRLAQLPVHGFHIDLVRAPTQHAAWRAALPNGAVLSAGIVDGRNVWRTDLRRALDVVRPLHDTFGDRLWIAPSCSLLHVPVSLADESELDPEVRPWLAFAAEKLTEIQVLADALTHGEGAVEGALESSDKAHAARRHSRRVVNEVVRERVSQLTSAMAERASPYSERIGVQRKALRLPALPTTTIGSFPQTPAVRQSRAAYKRRDITALTYLQRIRNEIELTVRRQEALRLDVLVHGEAERNDMVEYFAEHLWGYAVTANAWVQSYGSRCVKPPIVYGDVYRPEPITVDTIQYAQSLTSKPMKGMLTGPVTMLQWSFVRDDQPRAATGLQLALAIRDEVEDLEKGGIRVIQIDEPALREGLPLTRR
ncbi:MAG TPA: 5-methyltetrahydropteroyltriglutamate--homocysteine S-methyltransferase, partial [Burkholderiales bacterium]|nr:5-methyltetrahydropteroyltriglutamate--homocysteine S-methyltransferase [Burkholderiales bacterium]